MFNLTKSLNLPKCCRYFSSLKNKAFIKNYNINGYKEEVLSIDNLNITDCLDIIKGQTISVLGYGPQGAGQSLNLLDNGYPVILGLRKNGNSWKKAMNDGWVENKNLFEIEEAVKRGDIIQYLLSDAAQISECDIVKSHLTENKTLYFSHGFGIVYDEQTRIVPPNNIDVIMVAPKGPGGLVRKNFLLGNKGINASYAIHQDYTGNSLDKCIALSYGIGSKNLFETTFKNEVYSDLTGERSVLMGLIQGAFKAQYDVLREKGHSPMECFNETVEEALQSLYPLVNEKGMDWMFANCSATAQRGALDWSNIFYERIKPIVEDCYRSVEVGMETKKVIIANSDPNYKKKLEKDLKKIDEQEIWITGKHVRDLRATNKNLQDNKD
jgi:ketol-acid reductoisomerase